MKPRLLYYVHDGGGLGHLRRTSRIASSLQTSATVLVVTGMREASWMLPPEVEYIHIPNWDSLLKSRAIYWERQTWLDVPKKEALRMRSDLLKSVFDWFSPDAFIADYLPFGKDRELEQTLAASTARHYYLLRGIVDTSDLHFLGGVAAERIAAMYDRILVAADPRCVDVLRQCHWGSSVAEKLCYVGYVAPVPHNRNSIRASCGIDFDAPWVVCSGGGGMNTEFMLRRCVELGRERHAECYDVVFGPKAAGHVPPGSPRVRVHREVQDLPEWHSAAHVAVIPGGYNSIMEAMTGGTRIIVYPSQRGDDDEQRRNVETFQRFYPIRLLTDLSLLDSVLSEEICAAVTQRRPERTLDMNGVSRIAEIITRDLGCAVTTKHTTK